ncbi:MAG: type II toxin-antitoxin system Phd/YefM family antitoxin [Thermodesulfobacteriota bacterium]
MEINAAEFRSKCFTLLEQVKTTHKEIIITKRGKPIAKLTHIAEVDEKDLLLGALSGWGKTVCDLTEPVVDAEDWEIDS